MREHPEDLHPSAAADSLETLGFAVLGIMRWEARRMRGETTPEDDAAVATIIAKLTALAPSLATEVARYIGAAKAAAECRTKGRPN